MKIGLIGKPNAGKSTLFKALTEKDIEIANYPFTTINSSEGVCFATVRDVSKEFNLTPNPKNSKVEENRRLIPIKILDVAGLVPGASSGKGMGNQFLGEIAEAKCLIQVLDMSGTTDEKGEPTQDYNPEKELIFIEEEIEKWLQTIITKNWSTVTNKIRIQKIKPEEFFAEKYSGLGITRQILIEAIHELSLEENPQNWSNEKLEKLVTLLREKIKPIIYACNKMDLENSQKNLDNLINKHPDKKFIPISADLELALKNANSHNLIKYLSGSNKFQISGNLTDQQKNALNKIQTYLEKNNSTGVQEVINHSVFNVLNLIPVYPVEDETHLTDKNGNVLPDVFLMKKGSTVLDLAYEVHTEIGRSFIRAIDVRTKKIVGKDHELKENDVIKIVANK